MKKNLFFKFTQIQSERVKKNFFALFSNFSTQILVQIIYPPLMLLFWGIENFGIWRSILIDFLNKINELESQILKISSPAAGFVRNIDFRGSKWRILPQINSKWTS